MIVPNASSVKEYLVYLLLCFSHFFFLLLKMSNFEKALRADRLGGVLGIKQINVIVHLSALLPYIQWLLTLTHTVDSY